MRTKFVVFTFTIICACVVLLQAQTFTPLTGSGGGGAFISGDRWTITQADRTRQNFNYFKNIIDSIEDCDNATTSKLLFDVATLNFTCGTDQGGGGTGDVVGPASATDNAIAVYNGTTGKLIKNSSITVSGSGTLSGTNSGDVTLSGTPNYITIAGQIITRALIDLTTHVTGRLPLSNLAQSGQATRLLGRGSAAGAGDFEPIILGSGLSMSGTTLTATGGGGGGVGGGGAGTPDVLIRKTSDEGVSNTTLQDDNELLFPVLANEAYIVRYVLLYSAPTAGDFKINVAGPTGTVYRLGAWGLSETATGVTGPFQTTTLTEASGSFTFGGSGFSGLALLEGSIEVSSTAGNITFQFAQGTTSGTTTVLARSAVVAWRHSPAVPAGHKSTTILTSGTAQTYTVPSDTKSILVRMIGAGGGGGGSDGAASSVSVGCGGGSGAYAEKRYSVSVGQTFTYTVGAAGTGGAAGQNAGANGGNTLFDEGGSVVTAEGGSGGGTQAPGTTHAGCANSDSSILATGGDLNVPGQQPTRGTRLSGTTYVPSMGASGLLGVSPQFAFNGAGVAADGYGAGGGAASSQDTTDRAGGNGAPGVIIIYEYR